MISAPPHARILVASKPVDFRKGLPGLSALVETVLQEDPFAGDVFIFRSKRADRVKILVWDGTGMWLHYKRLEAGRFLWPSPAEGMIRLSASQLSVLLDGLDWRLVKPRHVKRPLLAC
jgi:transposase